MAYYMGFADFIYNFGFRPAEWFDEEEQKEYRRGFQDARNW